MVFLLPPQFFQPPAATGVQYLCVVRVLCVCLHLCVCMTGSLTECGKKRPIVLLGCSNLCFPLNRNCILSEFNVLVKYKIWGRIYYEFGQIWDIRSKSVSLFQFCFLYNVGTIFFSSGSHDFSRSPWLTESVPRPGGSQFCVCDCG